MSENQEWLGLMIGNTRLHWGYFVGAILQKTWDIDRIQELENQGNIHGETTVIKLLKNTLETQDIKFHNQMPLLIASVVPQQAALWQTYSWSDMITLDKLPLQGLYPTLGIDRALAVLGAGTRFGWPVLVIDTGTAITFTGADVQKKIVGGSILPGLRLQLSSLMAGTAMLPLVDIPVELPPRWAKETATAIQSGVIYTVLAGIKSYIVAWRKEFPQGKIVFTGGDRTLLLTHFKKLFPELSATIIDAPEVIFWGMAKIWHQISQV